MTNMPSAGSKMRRLLWPLLAMAAIARASVFLVGASRNLAEERVDVNTPVTSFRTGTAFYFLVLFLNMFFGGCYPFSLAAFNSLCIFVRVLSSRFYPVHPVHLLPNMNLSHSLSLPLMVFQLWQQSGKPPFCFPLAGFVLMSLAFYLFRWWLCLPGSPQPLLTCCYCSSLFWTLYQRLVCFRYQWLLASFSRLALPPGYVGRPSLLLSGLSLSLSLSLFRLFSLQLVVSSSTTFVSFSTHFYFYFTYWLIGA